MNSYMEGFLITELDNLSYWLDVLHTHAMEGIENVERRELETLKWNMEHYLEEIFNMIFSAIQD